MALDCAVVPGEDYLVFIRKTKTIDFNNNRDQTQIYWKCIFIFSRKKTNRVNIPFRVNRKLS